MADDGTERLHAEVALSGFHPEVVSAALDDSLAGEPVLAHVVHHEPTFDRDEVRRHMTVLSLTDSRLLVAHTDESPGDHLLPTPHTSTAVEAVPISNIASVLVNRLVSTDGRLEEAVLTIAWRTHQRIDLEPARCDDPECEADHGYTGALSGDDFSLRLSATADGPQSVAGLLHFGRTLSGLTTRSVRA